jgi:peroxiredoxin
MARPILSSVALLVTIMLATSVATAASEPPKTLEIGAKAPDFALPGTDGKTHRLANYDKAKVLVIVFTTNHCPTAQAYEDRIQKLAVDYKDKGVALVAISPNDPRAVRLDELGYTDVGDSLDDMKVRAKDKGFKFPYLYDGDKQEVSRAYGPATTPHLFIFDAERRLRYVGRIDDNERDPNAVKSHDARNAIEALLAGKPVPVETTRTFGCSVKWSDKRDSVKQAFERWAKEPVTSTTVDLEEVQALLKNDTDKLRLVNIWSMGCPPCIAEFPDLVELHRMYRGREFELVTINVDGPARRDKAHQFLTRSQASSTNYMYTGEIYPFLEAVDPKWPGAIPFTLLIKPGGEVLYRHMGMIDPLTVKKAIVGHLGRTYK